MNFKHNDKVVHLGGKLGTASKNRGKVLTILEGPLKIAGFSGDRYIVDKPVYKHSSDKATMYHANSAYLLKLL